MRESMKSLVMGLSFVTFVSSTFIGFLVLGYFVGNWLDGIYLKNPFGKILGILLGSILSIYSIYKHTKRNFLQFNRDV